VEYVFSTIYVMEAAIKITAFTFVVYISDSWNKFDFLLVCLSILDVAVDIMLTTQAFPVPPGVGRALRIIKVAFRMFRACGRLVRVVNEMMKAMAAKDTRTRHLTKITEKQTVGLNQFQEEEEESFDLLSVQQLARTEKPDIPEEYRHPIIKAKIVRCAAPGRRVCVSLNLKKQRVGTDQGLFCWKEDDEDGHTTLGFRPAVFQVYNQQKPVRLELLVSDIIGMVYVFHENGAVELQKWRGKEVQFNE